MARTVIATARLAPLIRSFVESINVRRNGQLERGGVAILAEASGLPERTLRIVANGERATCHLETADKILVALDRVDLWHLPPELGGFADVYFDGIGEAA